MRRNLRSPTAAVLVALVLACLAPAGVAAAVPRPTATELRIAPAVGALYASWNVAGTNGLAGFRVRWRARTTPAGPWRGPVELGAHARSYRIAGLPEGAVSYEVRVRTIVSVARRSSAGRRRARRRLGGGASAAATTLPLGPVPPAVEPQRRRERPIAPEAPPKAPPRVREPAKGGETPDGREPPQTVEQPHEGPKPEEATPGGEPPPSEPPVTEPPRTEPPSEPPPSEPPPSEPPPSEPPPSEPPPSEPPPSEPPPPEPPLTEPPPTEPPLTEPPSEQPPGEPPSEPPPSEPPGEPPVGSGCSLYASPSGNDTAKGTQGSPLRSVTALLARLGAGQTGCLAAGSYGGFTTRGGESHGSAGAPVTITSTDPQAPATIAGRIVTMPGADHLAFTHLDFADPEAGGPSVTIGSADTSWTYDDVTAPLTICLETTGAGQYGPAEDTLVEHDRVHNCGQPFTCTTDTAPCSESPNNGYFIHGLYDLGVRTTVRNSYFYEISSKGILLRGSSGSIVEHNVIDGNGSGVLFGDLSPEGDVVRWNIITNSHGVCGGCHGYYGFWTFGTIGPGDVFANNDVFGNSTDNLGDGGAVSVAEDVEVDPRFVDAAEHDYALQPGSPALGYGPE